MTDIINQDHTLVPNAHILVKHAYHQDTVTLVYQKSKEDMVLQPVYASSNTQIQVLDVLFANHHVKLV
jgi:hypothetical protein